ncbi:MAG: PAS domain S-box protein [Anaerolineales bacterium]|nr:PAS domain S-box protein [Anaerolineales bacterium]
MVSVEPPFPADESSFQLLFYHHPLPMWLYDLETLVFLEVNAAAVDKYGYSRAEFLAMTIKDIRPVEDVPRLLADVAAVRPALQHSGQWRHRLKDGTLVNVDITSHRLTFNSRPAALVVVQDITQHLQTEAALRRLNRTYAVLNGINQAIIRQHNPQALFQAACRIAIEAGGFRLAWVGLANNVTGRIEVVAQAGEAGDYLEKINLVLSDETRKHGPTPGAYLTGRHIIVNNVELDSRMAPWRADALRQGYQAVAAFPLVVKGVARGTFSLYAPETGFFDEKEVALLDGLAEDIAFALERAEQAEAYRQAENALNEAEAGLRRAANAANVGLWDMDLRTLEVHYSPEWKRQLGYEDHEIFNDYTEWQSRVHPDDLPKIADKIRAYLQNPHPNFSYEYRLRHKDGSYRWILAQASLEVDAQGQAWRMLGSHIDITERKQAEAALRESEERFRRYFELGLIGMAISSPVKGMMEVNDQLCHMLGYSRNELLQKSWHELTHPDDWADDQAYRNRVLAGEIDGFSLDKRYIRRDGQIVEATISVKCLRLANGAVDYFVALILDITERKRTEAQLRLQSAALTAAANTIVITDREGLIQWVNPAFTRLTGYEPAEAVGHNLRDLVKSGKQNPAVYANLWQTILAGQVWQGELINRRKDGSLYTEEQTITPLRNEAGEITYFIAIKQDISARKQLEAENQQLLAQVYQAQKLESIGRLAGGIAHDFNNLLVPIVGYTELGMLKLNEDSQLYSDLNRIKGAGERAAQLTRQILAFSRQQMLEIRTLDLNEVVTDFLPMLTRLIGEDIIFQTRLEPDLPPIRADKGQLEQVMLNLVVNARDAMPDGGTLIIETTAVMLDRVYVARHAGAKVGPHVMLAVSDTGHGMDAATQQRIFEPFFTTKAQGQGTGLGLATAFGIVKQHGGNIWVYSEPGRGSTFKIYLPLTTVPIPTAKIEPENVGTVVGTETILLVEDEPGVRQLIRDALREHGYQVLETGEPEKGLTLAQTHSGPIHLLLTDVIMPQINGRDLYQRVAASRTGLKVLYMSGYTDEVIAHHHVLDQGVAFLQKPFTIYGMLQKVRAVLG